MHREHLAADERRAPAPAAAPAAGAGTCTGGGRPPCRTCHLPSLARWLPGLLLLLPIRAVPAVLPLGRQLSLEAQQLERSRATGGAQQQRLRVARRGQPCSCLCKRLRRRGPMPRWVGPPLPLPMLVLIERLWRSAVCLWPHARHAQHDKLLAAATAAATAAAAAARRRAAPSGLAAQHPWRCADTPLQGASLLPRFLCAALIPHLARMPMHPGGPMLCLLWGEVAHSAARGLNVRWYLLLLQQALRG